MNITGLHGVGASCTNALSSHLTLTIKQNGTTYEAKFEKGIITENLKDIKEPSESTGTICEFKYDDEIWKDQQLDPNKVKSRLKQLAYLNPGLNFYFIVTENDEVIEEKHIVENDGMKAYIKNLNKGKTMICEIIDTEIKEANYEVQLAMAYNDGYDTSLYTYVNSIPTKDGGSHLNAIRRGVSNAINSYIKDNLSQVKSVIKDITKFETSDTVEGLTATLALRISEPIFEGQNKAKLNMPELTTPIANSITQIILEYFDKEPNVAKSILEKIKKAYDTRKAIAKARDAIRKQKNLMDGTGLPGNLADCSSNDPKECEVYIVEGDSAGGSAKQARDRKTQAILPVFGKILNVEKKRIDKVISSDKIMQATKALGCGLKEEFDIDKLKYHKIIIMSDADIDGAHIQVLWITYIYRYMRPIIENGFLYVAMPPLFKVVFKKAVTIIKEEKEEKTKILYVYNDAELEELKTLHEGNIENIQRYKGLKKTGPYLSNHLTSGVA